MTLDEKSRQEALKRDDHECRNCGKNGEETSLQLHHIVPRVMGGTNRLSNLATLCESCHDNVHGLMNLSQKDMIKSGIDRAKREGKWLGQVPAGFERDDDGYLQPNLDPDHDAGEVGYLEIRSALEQIDNGESYRKAANGLRVTRQTLSSIDQDEDRRQWYLEADADDELVADALEPIRTG